MRAKKEKAIRFAALIRVSTEKQEKTGESLKVQESQIQDAVKSLGGKITKTYAGQEHATPGYERELMQQMLVDARSKKPPFDAIMLADISRWSRDNASSKSGLDILRKKGIRFFIQTVEHDLFNPETVLFLGFSAEIGEYQARTQSKKSIESKIKRAKRGVPSNGTLPFARNYDKSTGRWSVDAEECAMITDIAERYLAGESLPELCKEYGRNYPNIAKTLKERCGSIWTVRFKSKIHRIDEKVDFVVPRLLSEATIKKIKAMSKTKQTFDRKNKKNNYLLSGRIFCDHCGYGFCGQTNASGKQFYRHNHKGGAGECSAFAGGRIHRLDVEVAVLSEISAIIINPAEMEAAVNSAIPADTTKLEVKLGKREAELARVTRGRKKILNLIVDEKLTEDEAGQKLTELSEREVAIQNQLEKIREGLAPRPDLGKWKIPEDCKMDVELTTDASGKLVGIKLDGLSPLAWIDNNSASLRKTLDFFLSEPQADGRPGGVYISMKGEHKPRSRKKPFNYRLKGRFPKCSLINVASLRNISPFPFGNCLLSGD